MTPKQKFQTYDANNPLIWENFVRFTDEALAAGHSKMSAWFIINRIRWYVSVETTQDEGFKISNNFIAYYSRKFMATFPEKGKVFNTKKMKGET